LKSTETSLGLRRYWMDEKFQQFRLVEEH